MDAVLTAFSEAFAPPSREPIHEWAKNHVTLHSSYQAPGPFHIEKSLYLKRPLECLQDQSIREVTIYKAVQTGGTLVAELYALWMIANRPSNLMWNMQTDDDAKDEAEMRMNKLLEECPPVSRLLPTHRSKKKKTSILFYNMWMLIQGCGLSNLQSKSVETLFNDELWMWPPGHYGHAVARTTAFEKTRKILNVSQGGLAGDEMDMAFAAGSQEIWGFRCCECGLLQPYAWKQLKYDTNDVTFTGTEWNLEELDKTIRFECAGCGHKIYDTPRERHQMNESGEYIVTNPGAPKDIKSFRWNALACTSISWRKHVRKWIRAEMMKRNGSIELLKEFIQKDLAEAFQEKNEDAPIIVESDFLMGSEWQDKHERILTVDVQKSEFWAVCRDWSKDGRSRLFWEGKLLTFEEIREKQLEFDVKNGRVIIDSGFRAVEVYKQCCHYKWTAFKGEDKEYFLHKNNAGDLVRKVYSPEQRGDPGIGTATQGLRSCKLILWSNPSVKDMLDGFRRGLYRKHEIPKDISQEYLTQTDSETKKLFHNKKTGRQEWTWVQIPNVPNHLWDCECMQIVGAVIVKVIGTDVVHEKPKEKT